MDGKLIRNVVGSYRAFFEEHAESYLDSLDIAACESPIETAFFLPWRMLMRHNEMVGSGHGGGAKFEIRRNLEIELADYPPFPVVQYDFMCQQLSVGRFRADFGLVRIVYEYPSGTVTKSQNVIVECDGHEFHDKTKEQAARDKRRDRELQSLGYAVLRFTGSEIWNDPFGCARQADEFLDESISRSIRERRQ